MECRSRLTTEGRLHPKVSFWFADQRPDLLFVAVRPSSFDNTRRSNPVVIVVSGTSYLVRLDQIVDLGQRSYQIVGHVASYSCPEERKIRKPNWIWCHQIARINPLLPSLCAGCRRLFRWCPYHVFLLVALQLSPQVKIQIVEAWGRRQLVVWAKQGQVRVNLTWFSRSRNVKTWPVRRKPNRRTGRSRVKVKS